MHTSRDDAFTAYASSRSSVLMGTAVRLMAGNVGAAEDLVQETLVRAYTSWNRVRDPQLRDAYVRRIMVNLSQTRQFRRPAMPGRGDISSRPADDGGYAAVHDRMIVWSRLAGLSGRQRTVLVLRYYLDLSEAETAAAMGCSIGSVKTHAFRALQRLRSDITTANDSRR